MNKTDELKINGFSEISENEMRKTDGGGLASAFAGAFGGGLGSGVISGLYTSCQYAYSCATGRNSMSGTAMGQNILRSMRDGAISGAAAGFVMGAAAPFL